METFIRSGGAYLDSPDVAWSPGWGVAAAAAEHARGVSRVAAWRLDGSGRAERTWSSGPLEGLFGVRLGTPFSARPVACAWCCVDPATSRVHVLEVGTDRVRVLEDLWEARPVVGDPGLLVARRGERVVAIGTDGRLVATIDGAKDGGRVFGPVAAVDAGGVVVVWEQEREAGCGIFCCRIGTDGRCGPVLRLDAGAPTAHAPAVARHPGGGVVAAWHSPARFPAPQLLVKDVTVAMIRDGRLLHPEDGSAPPPGPEPSGEDQGCELPSVEVSAAGVVNVLARGSHGFFHRLLAAGGWGPPARLDEPGWGCRGPAIGSCLDGRDGVWVATRERGGVAIRRIAPARAAGPCAFVPPREPRAAGGIASAGGGRGRASRRRDRDGMATWFGDIHQHSAFSDGTGAPRETYVRARDLYGDDLVALTDHESFLGKRTPPGEWAYLKHLAQRFEEPGRFATLLGYEWTGAMTPGPGHKVVYVPDADAPLVSRDDEGAHTGAGLLARIAGHDAVALPHHVGWTGADEESHDERLQPCFEVVSCHGAYETREDTVIGRRGEDRGRFLLELLRDGLRFGFTGGSDGHGLLYQHGVSRKRDAHRTGLTCVICREPSRPEVMRAVRSRRVYATSGVAMWVRLWVDGLPMGSVAPWSRDPRIEMSVDAYASLEALWLVTAVSERHLPCRGREIRLDTPLGMDAGRARFVYLRVLRKDGEMAWSSPVFFSPGP